ncbi:MAG: 16S rRNA (cytidine(1402)-2'-O)-methyltransferase [Hydrogenibacillus sp.]|nr:16S rRNA (cytidine(1402)-2'-O)-methyltransferase [Hydrogenibacillus sp.]
MKNADAAKGKAEGPAPALVREQVSERAAGGVLYVVGTPIGHLKDITYRAVEVLGAVDLIAAEDTRVARKLLSAYGIKTPVESYHDHSPPAREKALIERLQSGARVALVSDAGMPGISDPGERLVRLAIAHGIPVVPVPGPSAAVAALAASGLPPSPYVFVGFLPRRDKARKEALQRLRSLAYTLVFYEAPHRIVPTLSAMVEAFGPREAVLARELTKRFETFWRGNLAALLERAEREALRGEITLVVAGTPDAFEAFGDAEGRSGEEAQAAERALREALSRGLSGRDAVRVVAAETGLARRTLYCLLNRLADDDGAGPRGCVRPGRKPPRDDRR